MKQELAPTIFESFNARALNPTDVARRFVPSEHFDLLLKRRHSLVIGPRGSGKTTLLKMLQQPALEAWSHPMAQDYLKKVDFTGIFVPTDITWGEQIQALGEGQLNPESQRLLSVAAFTTHVLSAALTAVQHRTKPSSVGKIKAVQINSEKEAEIVQMVSKSWHITNIIPSFGGLEFALHERLSNIFEIASQEVILGDQDRNKRLAAISFLHLHFLPAAKLLISAVDQVAGVSTGKWALMFDELELAPEWIQRDITRFLRSVDERFLFKLALSPFTENESLIRDATKGASQGQDFDAIALWYPGKEESAKFCNELWYQMLEDRGFNLSTSDKLERFKPSKILGESYFETDPSQWRGFGTAYHSQSKPARRFSDLAEKDKSFFDYLRKNKILSLKGIASLPESKRASLIRKISPLVAVREFYRRPDVAELTPGTLRSRKTAILYSGADSLFAITEGNPRWFIAIVDRLLDKWNFDQEKKIDEQIQAEEVFNAGQRFQAMLRTIPVPAKEGADAVGALDIVEIIANFFHYRIVRAQFKPDPPETFEIDSAVKSDILLSLIPAINTGAIIYVSKNQQFILTSLESMRGQRFRLSYLLAPMYGLPLRLGKERSLSMILGRHFKRTPAKAKRGQTKELPFADDYEIT